MSNSFFALLKFGEPNFGVGATFGFKASQCFKQCLEWSIVYLCLFVCSRKSWSCLTQEVRSCPQDGLLVLAAVSVVC